MLFDCLLYRCLDVAQVLIGCCVFVSVDLCCYDGCPYLFENEVFLPFVSVFGEYFMVWLFSSWYFVLEDSVRR